MNCKRCNNPIDKAINKYGSMSGIIRIWNPNTLCLKCQRETSYGQTK